MRTKEEQDLVRACQSQQFDTIDDLLRRGINPNIEFNSYPSNYTEVEAYKTPLGAIMRDLYSSRHIEAIEALLNAGANVNGYTHLMVNRTRSTPLGLALSATGMIKPEIRQAVVRLLLSRGADVNLISQAELVKCMDSGNVGVFELLLDAGLNPNTIAQGKTLLEHFISSFAIRRSSIDKNIDIARLLINRGANLTVTDARGKSLLKRTSIPEIAHLLIEKNDALLADMTLHDHVILQSPELIERLIARGDNIDEVNVEGNTPLMEAAQWGYPEGAFTLMNAGANLNCHNAENETALHLAMAHAQNFASDHCDYTGNPRYFILLELYSRGAAPQLDRRGRTPLMRCHIGGRDYPAIYFCIREFSKFEAAYYSFDLTEYSHEMQEAYKKEMGRYEAFSHLRLQGNPQHLFTNRLVKILPVVPRVSSRDELVERATKDLLIALKTNNVTKARWVINQFPEINLNRITDEKGQRPLSIVIRSVYVSKNNCCPMLGLLIENHADVNLPDETLKRETPLFACMADSHHIDLKSLQFLLANRANPNIGNVNNYTPLHKATATFRYGNNVDVAIEALLTHGALFVRANDGKTPINTIVESHKENNIQSLFEQCQPQRGNIIDEVLQLALSPTNRTLFAAALKMDVSIMLEASEVCSDIPLSLSDLIESIREKPDCSLFTKNRLAFLSLLQNDPTVLEKTEFSDTESQTLYNLIHRLYEADCDVIKAIAETSATSAKAFDEIQKMQEAARKIQFWVRKHLPSKLPSNSEPNVVSLALK